MSKVCISYIRPSSSERIYQTMTMEEAREFWAALAQPLRESAIVTPVAAEADGTKPS